MKILTGELDAQKGTVVRPRKFGVSKYGLGNRAIKATVVARDETTEVNARNARLNPPPISPSACWRSPPASAWSG